MPGAAKKEARKKLLREDDERTLESMKRELKQPKKDPSSLSKRKVSNCLHEGNGNLRLKKKIVKKAIACKTKTSKKQPSLSGLKDKLTAISAKESEKTDDRDVNPRHLKRRRRRKKRKNNVELDEACRLQRRTRYLLIKMKLEQNLIDAYSAEGWKGQSREKIKPEKELQRAKKQILKCKLGIREAIRQLDLLSSEGRINDSVVAPDGAVHHEHIVCAKCKLQETLPDNDIILCDGTCNCAFHQKCLDPPLSTENIPPGDEGWFCKFCKKKMEILEATNAHIGTHFPMDSNWQDVFKEEAVLPDDGNSTLCPEEEWPSDDSEDDDYDPDRIEQSRGESVSGSESEASDYSSSLLLSLEDEPLLASGRESNRSYDNSLELIGVDSDEINNGEVVCRPRQRAAVDYIKLYDEMFGKNAAESEQISDDEDWGPTKRKRKGKENDAASTLMTLGETDKINPEEMPSELKEKQLINKIKRPIFRLPHNAVEKLRLVFSENELPARALRVSLSKQLGLEFEKVNKWFKNARYLALKARKQAEKAQVSQDVGPSIQKESFSETTKDGHPDQMALENPKSSKELVRRRKAHLLTSSFKIKQRRKPLLQTAESNQVLTTSRDLGDDVSLKHLREEAKEAKKKLNCKSRGGMTEAETEMERLCRIKNRVEELQQVLLQLPSWRFGKTSATNSSDVSVIYVPVAELREKR
ncbi:pathogenesis-related homeodomain protein isoform X1 [Sesamum indicum]|uniref:Pathogenesis-related homeodomain protein isoform X1 n=1 Tax=Sesamum indicum TaxID=4182 RepID=A0A8M8V2B5_SESIN|nr:pathogenesis-related homeodomain protein isoform X1 [Sesamum indicum]XP_020553237.1 pathogenesis-related homeodomain protein isoform X1 [Sesamum indicum]XP_020553238.1 pathogenesis-related homeodomain protein isoform X1 [Sesamum indicum]